jgi:hypothetical protein
MFNYQLIKMEETGIMRNIWSSIQSFNDKPEAQGMTFIHQYLIKILAVSAGAHTHTRMLSCFVGHTSTNLITEVMQRWARL